MGRCWWTGGGGIDGAEMISKDPSCSSSHWQWHLQECESGSSCSCGGAHVARMWRRRPTVVHDHRVRMRKGPHQAVRRVIALAQVEQERA